MARQRLYDGPRTPAVRLFRAVIYQAILDAIAEEQQGREGGARFAAWASSHDGRAVFSMAELDVAHDDVQRAAAVITARHHRPAAPPRPALPRARLAVLHKESKAFQSARRARLDAEVTRLRAEGLTLKQIGQRLGFSPVAIHKRLKRMVGERPQCVVAA